MIIGDGIMLGASGESASILVTGLLSETDNVKATQQIPMKVKNPDYVVPDGYTQFEYIESTGTQCINIELTENSGYGIRMKFAVSSLHVNHQPSYSGTLDT